MHYTKQEIEQLDRVQRIKFINAVSGVKAANLIGTISEKGITNVAIFNSVMHLGSDPALMGFILRPVGDVPRHTYENMLKNGSYTINHVNTSIIKKAHYTSAKFDDGESEFRHCALTEEFVDGIVAPFVKESHLKIGLKYIESIPIERNGTILVIGEIEHLIIPQNAIREADDIDLSEINSVGISGLNTYYDLKKLERFPYVRRNEVPDFK
ncbi:flavin reductase family protein [Cellulophaga sp. Hel_I_12]|uniref:flavin reductase family protein n=1 Tax=Cellulophaga sp. Hel_I_12 TaxID=1249972 RepID=UPI000648BAC6|nr:flavin reductase [Cellulophaga sp. Hel_I_12]